MKVNITRQELSDLLSKRMSYQEIGNKYGVTRQAIQLWVKKYNLTYTRTEKLIPKLLSRSDLEKIQRIKFTRKRQNSKVRTGNFTVEFSDLIWPDVCPILGIPIDYYTEIRSENSPSFDQKVPGLGYTKENTQIISWRANRIKNDGTWKEHRLISDYMKNQDMKIYLQT